MFNRTEILGIITARGGSKGVPGKNIRNLNGIPLIGYTIEAAKKSRYLDRVVVSTDSEEIAYVSEKAGAEVPFYRPVSLAGDASPSWEAILHALEWFGANEKKNYPVFCLLQPTSPFRTFEHIDAAVEKFFSMPGAESLVSVTKSIKSPYWAQTVSDNGYLKPLISSEMQYSRRQDVPKSFDLNGAIYIADTGFFLKAKSFLGKKTTFYEMDKYASLDIDCETDFRIAEALTKIVIHE